MGDKKLMSRYFIDCRDYPGGTSKCSVALSADTKEELLEAVIRHGIQCHGLEDTSDFREKIMLDFKEAPSHFKL